MKLAVDFLLKIVGYRGAWNSDGLSGPQPLAGGDMVAQGASSSGLPRLIAQPLVGGGGVGAQGALSSGLPWPMAQPLADECEERQVSGHSSSSSSSVVCRSSSAVVSGESSIAPGQSSSRGGGVESAGPSTPQYLVAPMAVGGQGWGDLDITNPALRFPAVDVVEWQGLQCWSVIGAEARRASRALGRSSGRGGR